MDDIEFPLFSDKEVLSTDKSAGHVILPAAAITDLNTTTLPGIYILCLKEIIAKSIVYRHGFPLLLKNLEK